MILYDPTFPDDPFAREPAGPAWPIGTGWRTDRLPSAHQGGMSRGPPRMMALVTVTPSGRSVRVAR